MATPDKFEKLIINDRYLVQKKIGEGTFGSVYNCRDNLKKTQNLVIKISQYKSTAENEVNAIEKINNTTKSSLGCFKDKFPVILCKGFFSTEKKSENNQIVIEKNYMFIMKKYEQTLE